MVNEGHAVFGLKLHSFGEHLHELVHESFTFRYIRIVHKNDTVRVLLNWAPTFLIFEVTADIPQLKVDFAERGDSWGRVSLAFNNAACDGRSVELCYVLAYLTDDISDSGFAASLRTDY